MCNTHDMETSPATSRRTMLIGAAGTLGLLGAGSRSPAAATDAGADPRPAFVAEPIKTLDGGPRDVAVTFDDGPHPEFTPQVLTTLRRYRVRATFCVVGTEVERHPETLRAIHDAGHLVASHSWSHANLQELDGAGVAAEVERGLDAIGRVLPTHEVDWFRAPYGRWSSEVMGALTAHGLRPLGWSVDPRDWELPGAREIAERVVAGTTAGSIILNHDAGGDRSQTVAALDLWIPRLLAAGYRFTLPA